MSNEQLSVEPDELRAAAAKLDALAQRLGTTLDAQVPNLTAPASGSDEVSETSAATFNQVATDFEADGEQAVHELRKIAAVLRAQAGGYQRAEDNVTDTFLA